MIDEFLQGTMLLQRGLPDYHFYYLLDEHGQPVPTEDRHAVHEWLVGKQCKRRRLAETVFTYRGHSYRVSTVFLVFNHAHHGGPPVLWETMVFSRDTLVRDIQERYASRSDAEEGHKIIVDTLREALRRYKHRPSRRRKQVARQRIAAGQSVLGKVAR